MVSRLIPVTFAVTLLMSGCGSSPPQPAIEFTVVPEAGILRIVSKPATCVDDAGDPEPVQLAHEMTTGVELAVGWQPGPTAICVSLHRPAVDTPLDHTSESISRWSCDQPTDPAPP